jgi:hypothetical protein
MTDKSVIHLMGADEMRTWLSDVSEKTHIPSATIVRLALKMWAEAEGHPAPPKK